MITNRKQPMTSAKISSELITEMMRISRGRIGVKRSRSSMRLTRMFSTKAMPPPIRKGVRMESRRMAISQISDRFCNAK